MAAPSAFGVTAPTLRAAFFPHLDEFSTNSVPSAVQVADFINKSAAVLDGKLLQESISAAAIMDTTSAAYVWCGDTIQMAAAIRTARAMVGTDPDVVRAWVKELEARYADLDERGYLVLGAGAAAPAQEAEGPSHHIDEYSLEVDDPADMSDTIPLFRKSDLL